MNNKHRSTIDRREALGILCAGAVAFRGAAFAQKSPQFPKGAVIRTILKDMTPEELAGGATLFHEHMSVAPDFNARWMTYFQAIRPAAPAGTGARRGAPSGRAPAGPGDQTFFANVDLMVDEMKAAKADGVACIVDGGHEDMGRKLEDLKAMSERSGLPIVASGGYYAQPFYPPEIATMSEEQITKELVKRANTQPLGAWGEIGTWDEMTPDERKVFRAVSKAHLATNLPIFTHTNFGKGAVEQLDLFESMGVNPAHVCIGHIGGLRDPEAELLKGICKRGAFVGFDRQGGNGDAPNVPQVQALINAGYAGNLLFSSDFSSAAQLKHNGGPGYAKTVTVFVPKLREAGVKEEILHGILVDNPRRFLAFVPRKSRKSLGF